ncbi:MAG: ankyrin repeat domain-containing protein [Legionella sp.]|nr:ankyrin repeat domain-containing protein [Legionella sp.]
METRLDTSLINLPKELCGIILDNLNLKNIWSLELSCRALNKLLSKMPLIIKRVELEKKFPHESYLILNQFPTLLELESKPAQEFQQNLEKNSFYHYKTRDKLSFSSKDMEKLKTIPDLFRLIKAGDSNTISQIFQIKDTKTPPPNDLFQSENTPPREPLKIDFDDLTVIYKIRDNNNLSLIDWAIKMDMQSLLNHFKLIVDDWKFALNGHSGGMDFGMGVYQNNNQDSLLQWSITLQQPEAKERSKSKNLPIREKNIYGETPMHLAARNKDLSWLIELHALKSLGNRALNDLDNQNYTPWHSAASVGNIDAIEFLLNSGAPLPMTPSLNNELTKEEQLRIHNKSIKKLIRLMGTQLHMNHRQHSHTSVLHILTQYFEAKWLDYFFNDLFSELKKEISKIKNEININLNNDKSLLLQDKLIRLKTQFHILQAHYAAINQQNPEGLSALQLAENLNDKSKVEILLRHGAHINLETNKLHNNNNVIKNETNEEATPSNREAALAKLKTYIAKLEPKRDQKKNSIFGRKPNDKLIAAKVLQDVLLGSKPIYVLNQHRDILNKGTLEEIINEAELIQKDASNHNYLKL